MSMPGWYPDPVDPRHARYWDGSAWTSMTSESAGAPAPPPKRPAGRGRGMWVAIVAIVLVAALVTWFVVRPQTTPGSSDPVNTSEPTGSQWPETAYPSTPPPPTEAPSDGAMIACPRDAIATRATVRGGWLVGGGLKIPEVSQWRTEAVPMGWMHDQAAQTYHVTSSWFSMVGVGAIKVADGFQEPRLAAYQVMSCFATSDYYMSFQGREDFLAEPVTIGGHAGFRLRSEIHIDPATQGGIEGDVVDVIVVDLGNPESLGLFMSSATIGDDPVLDIVDERIARLAPA